MGKKKDKMEKCKTCTNLDLARSNENWVVCPAIPIEVLVGKSADDCKNYKSISNVDVTV